MPRAQRAATRKHQRLRGEGAVAAEAERRGPQKLGAAAGRACSPGGSERGLSARRHRQESGAGGWSTRRVSLREG